MRMSVARAGQLAVTFLAVLLAGLPALAAGTAAGHSANVIHPKDGTYKGTLSVGLKKVIVMTVSHNGKKAAARLVCDGQPYGYVHASISNGGFSGKHQRSPGVQVWTLKGQFNSSAKAVAHFGGGGVCDGKSGTVKLALT